MQLIKDGKVVYDGGSITDFLRRAPDYRAALRVYEMALAQASEASFSTRRKWAGVLNSKLKNEHAANELPSGSE